jgi:hypothetical protein
MPRTMTEIRTILTGVLEDLAEHEAQAAKAWLENRRYLVRSSRRFVAAALPATIQLSEGAKAWGAK